MFHSPYSFCFNVEFLTRIYTASPFHLDFWLSFTYIEGIFHTVLMQTKQKILFNIIFRKLSTGCYGKKISTQYLILKTVLCSFILHQVPIDHCLVFCEYLISKFILELQSKTEVLMSAWANRQLVTISFLPQ